MCRAPVAIATSLVVLFGAAACSDDIGPARDQVLLVVDTNVLVIGQLAGRDDRSRAAAIDTLRVDILEESGSIRETRELIAPDASDWPISFGILPTPAGVVRLRLRAFRALYAHIGTLRDQSTLEPPAEVTIDRIVAVTFLGGAVRTLRVKLEGDCLGIPSSFVPPYTTCVDGAAKSADPAAAIQIVTDDSSRSTETGSWQAAVFSECTAPQPVDDAVCIRGGFAILGDQAVVGIEGNNVKVHDSAPLRPVSLSPFYLDRHELSVGRLRKLGAASLVGVEEPLVPGRPANADCTFLGFDDGRNDALPLNCVTWTTARRICTKLGGELPSEAQWEYTARGRGEQRAYPWGSAVPGCCGLSVERSTRGPLNGCGRGVEPVGSHADPARCNGIADASRDGVLDLGGSMTELIRDVFQPYDAPCWGGEGIAVDPVCINDKSTDHVLRGARWNDGITMAQTALRTSNGLEVGVTTGEGFRCAYPGALP